MKNNLYISIDNHQRLDYLLRDNAGQTLLSGSAFHHDQLPEFPQDAMVSLIVPGTEVLILQLRLPKTSRSQLLKAIPYALEEQLIEEVDALHFAAGKQDDDGYCDVAVVKKQLIQQWLERCATLGLYPQLAIPDYLALPPMEKAWHLYLSGENALIRQNKMTGISVVQAQLKEVLSLRLLENTAALPEKIFINYDDSNEHFSAETLADLSVPVEMAVADCFSMELFAEASAPPIMINLLQGEYVISKPKNKNLRLWKWVAVLAGAWFVVWFAGNLTQYFVYHARLVKAKASVTQLYQQVFPQAKVVVEPRLRIQRTLNERQNAGAGGAFLGLLTQVGAQINKSGNVVTIENFNYRNNTLVLSLSANNFQTLAALTKALQEQGLSVQQQNSTTQGKTVTTRLTIKRSDRG